VTKNHIPQRTCVACRTSGPKRDLVRLVKTVDGAIEVDPSRKRDGRGAYLCAKSACWERALKGGALGSALRTTVSTADRDALREFGRTLQPAATVGS